MKSNKHYLRRIRLEQKVSVPCDSFDSFLVFGRIPLLISLCIFSYSSCLNGDFVFDDTEAIVRNPVIQRNDRFFDILTSDFWGKPIRSTYSHKSYRPITSLTFV
ncbi:hypothetical protein AB6A40_004805 [Gnathostoma spinigerum]|uniref:Uncharacterized protein n=1 Tax=Gnathostoma spinigerum TaxID=75299 RepID=A0ABD6EEM2_9BILA